jgi:hypothetical protein
MYLADGLAARIDAVLAAHFGLLISGGMVPIRRLTAYMYITAVISSPMHHLPDA